MSGMSRFRARVRAQSLNLNPPLVPEPCVLGVRLLLWSLQLRSQRHGSWQGVFSFGRLILGMSRDWAGRVLREDVVLQGFIKVLVFKEEV